MDRRIALIGRGAPFEICVNGRPITAYSGETVAGALSASGIIVLRKTLETGAERGQFCGMGICYDCVVIVNHSAEVRACMTAAEPAMAITVPAFVEGGES